jgi:hypothetical protein
MKKLCMISLLLVLAAASFAQKPTAESIRKRFSLGTTLFTDLWQNVPDTIDNRLINQGVDVYATYNFPMDKKGHMFFFVGAGIGAHNFYSKEQIKLDANNVSKFYDFPATVTNKATGTVYNVSVKKNKLSITYFDIPFGFQYKAKNKIHATLGFKVGWSINNHTKYKGTDYNSTESTGLTVKWKSAGLPNIQSIHYGPFATIGYKWVGLTACYQITSIFTKDLGPQIYPISVGLTFRPF